MEERGKGLMHWNRDAWFAARCPKGVLAPGILPPTNSDIPRWSSQAQSRSQEHQGCQISVLEAVVVAGQTQPKLLDGGRRGGRVLASPFPICS